MSQRDERAIVSEDVPRPWFALACTLVCLAAGLWVVARGVAVYPELPERVPTHFGFSGAPDAWSAKSFASVLALPLLALLMGPLLAGFATLVAWHAGHPASADPRLAFGARAARDLGIFMGGLALLVSGLQVTLSWGALEVARGARPGIPQWGLLFGLGVMLHVLVGAIVLIRRQMDWPAQPAGSDSAEHWRLGVLYVNPGDPAFIVPKRLGFGWTLNFGHAAARRIGWGFLWAFGLMMVLVVAAIASVAGSPS